jgi:hypothetical protein
MTRRKKLNPSNDFGTFEAVETTENESQHDSPDPATPAPLKILASAAMSHEELLKLKDHDPYGALDVIKSMDSISSKAVQNF